jgi:hypothetical protein
MALRNRLVASGLAALVLAGAATAQTTRQTTTTTTTTGGTEIRKASVVMNANVVIQGGTSVGRITDFVISDNGCIDFVVVDTNGQFVLVPFQVVRVDFAQHVVDVNVTREKWREIPTFTGTNWPVHDQAYIGKVRTVFGGSVSGYTGERREGDRRPQTPGEERREDRRNQPPQQRRDVENPNRPGTNPPATNPPPATRPGDRREQPPPDRDPNRRTPPPAPPGTPGTNPPPA